MGHPLRIFSRPRSVTVEIVQRTFQHRHLLQSESRLDSRIIGALAEAQARYGGDIHAVIVLSSHLHLLATFLHTKQMADFMAFFTRKVSIEAKRVHQWDDVVFPERYSHIELSQEAGVELQRLRYILSNGCKEGLVLSPLDWPGVSSARALVSGMTMKGVWLDRTALCKARGRRSGRGCTEQDFEEEREVMLSPVPSLAHLSGEAYGELIAEMIEEIAAQTLSAHRTARTVPLGATRLREGDPHRRQKQMPKRPRPRCHAANRERRQAMRQAIVEIVAAYRRAAERLKAGVIDVVFPAGTFPPSLAYVVPETDGFGGAVTVDDS